MARRIDTRRRVTRRCPALELRKRVSNGFAFDRPSADEIEVPAVGKFKHVRGALQRGDTDRRMREDTGQPHRLCFFQ